MDRQSIKGYAVAARVLDEALRGKVDGEKLASIFDEFCANPRVGLAKYMRLATANHVLDDVDADLAEALNMVDPDEGGELTVEEQGVLILDWYKARDRSPEGVTVRHAAEKLGVTQQRVIALINAGRLKAEKPKGRWVVDPESLEALVAERRDATDAVGRRIKRPDIDQALLERAHQSRQRNLEELIEGGWPREEAEHRVLGPKVLTRDVTVPVMYRGGTWSLVCPDDPLDDWQWLHGDAVLKAQMLLEIDNDTVHRYLAGYRQERPDVRGKIRGWTLTDEQVDEIIALDIEAAERHRP